MMKSTSQAKTIKAQLASLEDKNGSSGSKEEEKESQSTDKDQGDSQPSNMIPAKALLDQENEQKNN